MGKILGVDIGRDSMKLALVSGRKVKKTAAVSLPGYLFREGRAAVPDELSELLYDALRKNRMSARKAALVLPGEQCFVRNVEMFCMNEENLFKQMRYEFSDYVDDLDAYIYDYAMQTPAAALERMRRAPVEERAMELTAVAAPALLIEEYRDILYAAGLELVKAVPPAFAYAALIRDARTEYCFLDLGAQAIRMHLFNGDRHMATRVLETGFSAVDEIVAGMFNVNLNEAHGYFVNNYEDCQNADSCIAFYRDFSAELLRALEFYRYTNPDSRIADLWLSGGAASVRPLRAALDESLGLRIHSMDELPRLGGGAGGCHAFAQAIGATMS